MPNENHPPFLKWAGGKRWLINQKKIHRPREGCKYIEPFLGSGAMFFSICPKISILSDANSELIETYECIKKNPILFSEKLEAHHNQHGPEYYYKLRESKFSCDIDRAARFVYLNRTCWNGLYRVNLKGQFNVPLGTKLSVKLSTDDWQKTSEILSSAILTSGDFEAVVDRAGDGDVVFADPPYTVKHNLNGFVKYNESIFSWNDQVRLKHALTRAVGRNATIISTNAAHPSIRELYEDSFDISTLERASVLSGKSEHRGRYQEFFLTANYESN